MKRRCGCANNGGCFTIKMGEALEYEGIKIVMLMKMIVTVT